MWVRASLVGSSIGRKNLETSTNFTLQSTESQRNNKSTSLYRIITRHFPHYKVAEGDDYEEIRENFSYLNEVLILSMDGKKSSKNIAKWWKIWYEENGGSILVNEEHRDSYLRDDTSGDESSELSQSSIPFETILDPATTYFVQEPISICYPDDTCPIDNVHILQQPNTIATINLKEHSTLDTVSLIPTIDPQILTKALDQVDQTHHISGPINLDFESEINKHDEPSLESNQTETWWSSQGLGVMGNWFDSPAVTKKNNQDIGIWEIPIQLIALLTYPVTESTIAKKPTYAELREISQVSQRRKILLFLTCYGLIIRYASLDLFLLLLFMSNCGILFLMKNSAKVNMQMAKRTVRQRINWAKQWAGGFFRKNTSSNSSPSRPSSIVISSGKQTPSSSPGESPKTNQSITYPPAKPQKRFFLKGKNHTILDMSNPCSIPENGSSQTIVKQRRRFFSKSKDKPPNLPPVVETSDIEPVDPRSSTNQASPSRL
ncbi:hypothetical protein K7432_003129 [Basidiobolus ranarum]|uniref:Uncharacterized protein n=1 Tax=Basidiobolus ranarum TaxID=34480 RepID=A0ABR2W739_9FUNG